ncbi:type II toxin-antitoxin system MqsR family toxin [Trinickia terrae]|uniref:Type II toxin-antitoxin system MqsR family toxin n=1 Tax=Trinickia terrae TaxID=2571161 RepID=A0A4U1HK79_9BURK|nr:type II toxin-antitoxin system MqsR family toxin [Trinickia terrae]TKC81629.1 type II toxin-antitoxin system MqsR family toxin [Trinickia terrae]
MNIAGAGSIASIRSGQLRRSLRTVEQSSTIEKEVSHHNGDFLPLMPYFDLTRLQELVSKDCWDFLNEVDGRSWFGRAWKLMDDLGCTNEDVKAVLLGLTPADFQKTRFDCAVSTLPGHPTVIADQYEIHWDDEKRRRVERPLCGCISLSLKVTVVEDENGDLTGLVTLHSSGS